MKKRYLKKRPELEESIELGLILKPGNRGSASEESSESPTEFAIRALTQMEEGLKAYEAKHGTFDNPDRRTSKVARTL